VGGAVLLTLAAYRRQFQTALAPPASTGTIGHARLARALARTFNRSNRVAHATSDFVLITLVRNRTQQAPIAINLALGLAMVIVKFGGGSAFATVMQTPAVILGIPLMMLFWMCIGIRASFFVPSELPAAWTFRANAPQTTNAYARGTRAAIVGLVAPPAELLTLVLTALTLGWRAAIIHTAFLLLLLVALADFVVLTIDHIPFTRPYLPGHARLRARWPLYLFGAYGFAWVLPVLELYAWNEPYGTVILLSLTAALAALFELAVGAHRIEADVRRDGDVENDLAGMTVLDLNGFAHT
jgi:hypothetical protein